MFVLIKSKITGEYSTIYRKDIENFKNLHKFFNADPKLNGETVDFNFEIIEDINKIKEILDTEFTSKGRGEEYNEDLTSVSNIAYRLCPININTDKFLLRWKNNTPLIEQEGDKTNILSRGTWEHKILQMYVCDKEARLKDKPLIEQLKILQRLKKPSKKIIKQIDNKIISDIRRYIQMAYEDEEIKTKILNIDELKEELEFLAIKCLPKFIKEELIFTDLVYSEIFLCIDDYIQGSIDYVTYKDGKFTIIDYKTTSSTDKKTGKPKFKSSSQLQDYAKQLYLYNELLKKSGMTHLYDNSSPQFLLVQIHLLNGEYKKFTIPQGLVEAQGKLVEKVLNWYWSIRNDTYTPPEHEEFNELEYITL